MDLFRHTSNLLNHNETLCKSFSLKELRYDNNEETIKGHFAADLRFARLALHGQSSKPKYAGLL